jgi:hypothetical protein
VEDVIIIDKMVVIPDEELTMDPNPVNDHKSAKQYFIATRFDSRLKVISRLVSISIFYNGHFC